MSSLVMSGSLREFFRAVVTQAIEHQRVSIAEVTEFYLVNLLSDFASSERLFSSDEEGKREQEPLALLYHRALQQEREERIRTLRRLGDVSLYTAGFFKDSLREKPVGPDYYIRMGGTAYGAVAELAGQSAFSVVYRELHEKFRMLVDLLEEIAARGMVQNGAQGTLKVYEAWSRSGSERLERVLVEAGVVLPKGGGALPN